MVWATLLRSVKGPRTRWTASYFKTPQDRRFGKPIGPVPASTTPLTLTITIGMYIRRCGPLATRSSHTYHRHHDLHLHLAVFRRDAQHTVGTMMLFFRARQLPKGQRSFSVQLNSHVLRSIGTAALYYRAYNGSDPAVLHYTVRTTTVRSGTSTVSPLCL